MFVNIDSELIYDNKEYFINESIRDKLNVILSDTNIDKYFNDKDLARLNKFLPSNIVLLYIYSRVIQNHLLIMKF